MNVVAHRRRRRRQLSAAPLSSEIFSDWLNTLHNQKSFIRQWYHNNLPTTALLVLARENVGASVHLTVLAPHHFPAFSTNTRTLSLLPENRSCRQHAPHMHTLLSLYEKPAAATESSVCASTHRGERRLT